MVMELPENCTDIENAIHLYVGADLEPEIQRAVTRHLDGCRACRHLAEQARLARDAFLGLTADEPLEESVWGAVRAELERDGLLRGAPTIQRTSWWIVPAAAAASVAAVLLTLAWRGDASVLPGPENGPVGPQPIALEPVEDGAPSLIDAPPIHSDGTPFHPSVPGASAAGNRTQRLPNEPREIIR